MFKCFMPSSYTKSKYMPKIMPPHEHRVEHGDRAGKLQRLAKNQIMVTNIGQFEDDYLYIILPYFNFTNSKKRYQLFIEFINRLKHIKNIRIIISEATITDTFELPTDL